MCHECPECGQMCYCDGDDTFMEAEAEHCIHYLSDGCYIGEDEEDFYVRDANRPNRQSEIGNRK